jgi:tRNA nucleotidyltransferase/poly(A) polymerase
MSLKEAIIICKAFHCVGYEAFIVGGAIRDMLMGITPHDIDITTNATPDEIKNLFKYTNYRLIPLGEQFGTIAVIREGMEKPIEITTYRSEGKYTDKRHPDSVKFETKLDKDLERRDFTINAMAMNPENNEIIDLFGGKQDIINHVIKCIGNPEIRFQEDPLRMIRACRFSAKLGFVIEPLTLEAIKNNAHLINDIAMERVKDELFKLLESQYAYFGLEYMQNTGLMHYVLPEVAQLESVSNPTEHHKWNNLYHTFMTVEALPRQSLIRFAVLCHDIGKMHCNAESPYFPDHTTDGVILFNYVSERLKLSVEETNYVNFMIKEHMVQFEFPNWNTTSIKRWLSRISDNIQYLDDLFTLFNADRLATGYNDLLTRRETYLIHQQTMKILAEKPTLKVTDLALNGYDLMALGVPKNEIMGKVQKDLLDAVLSESVANTKEALTELVLKIKDWTNGFLF